MSERYAVIELGTRGIRLLVAEVQGTRPLRVIDSTGSLSQLGNEADAKGNLSEASVARVRGVVARYLNRIAGAGVPLERVRLVATEVVRQAPNRAALEEGLPEGLLLEVLSPQEEAACSLVASLDAFRGVLAPGSRLLVVDQGGGSTELALGHVDPEGHAHVEAAESLVLGTATLGRRLVRAGGAQAGWTALAEHARAILQTSTLLPDLGARPPQLVVGLGSASCSAARLAFGRPNGPARLQDIHRAALSLPVLQDLSRRDRQELLAQPRDRLDLMLSSDDALLTRAVGLPTFIAVLRNARARELRVSRHGLRFGVLLVRAGRAWTPPILASSA